MHNQKPFKAISSRISRGDSLAGCENYYDKVQPCSRFKYDNYSQYEILTIEAEVEEITER